MNPIFRTTSLLSALALGLCASTALATDTVTLEAGSAYQGQNPYQYGDGGEFTAFSSAGIPAGYNSAATLTLGGQTGFETFCIQPTVTYTVNTAYDFAITPDVWVPASGNSASGATDQALSQGGAWLYAQFASGNLIGYDYANSDSGNSRLTDAGELQSALWYLQGDTSAPSGDPFVDLAVQQFGSLGAAMAAETPGEFGTSVMDLYTAGPNGDPATLAQDQLIYTGSTGRQIVVTSAPDSASTLMLFGSVLVLASAGSRLRSRRTQA